jgi:RNase H-like domain found in reverse transcriptase
MSGFLKIVKSLTNLTMKDVDFNFDEYCLEIFCRLKKALMSTPILQPPDWRLSFEIMCDASDYAVRAVLGQQVEKKSHAIYYASKVLDDA